MIRQRTIAGLALGFLASPAVAASPLATSHVFVNGGYSGLCFISNIGTSAVTDLSVLGLKIDGTALVPEAGSCGATLGPGESCYELFPDDLDLRCEFRAKGKVRASLQIYDTAYKVIALYPATKK